MKDLQDKPYMKHLFAVTCAVLMGRHSFEMADPDTLADNYEFQVPIFIVTHRSPAHQPKENGRISFTFVTDGVEPAVRMAKAAAKDRNVTVVGGADLARQLFAANPVDDLHGD